MPGVKYFLRLYAAVRMAITPLSERGEQRAFKLGSRFLFIGCFEHVSQAGTLTRDVDEQGSHGYGGSEGARVRRAVQRAFL